jgi:hypothetical protein
MNISPEGVAITKRFFDAIDMIKNQRRIRGLKTFTDKFDINRRNLITVKKQPDASVLKPEWIFYLANEYNVSAEWVITGRGGMFTNKSGHD